MTITARDIQALEQSLFPEGRAWDLYTGSENLSSEPNNWVDGFENKWVDGAGNEWVDGAFKASSVGSATVNAHRQILADVSNELESIKYQLLPDNEFFDENDAENYENEFGIVPPVGSTLEERKKTILAKYYISQQGYNGTAEYLQNILQANGFDLYVHANRFLNSISRSTVGSARVGSAIVQNASVRTGYFSVREPDDSYTEICSNYLDPELDANIFNSATDPKIEKSTVGLARVGSARVYKPAIIDPFIQYRYTIFIGAQTYPEKADVPASRMQELRRIILQNKKTNVSALLYINKTL